MMKTIFTLEEKHMNQVSLIGRLVRPVECKMVNETILLSNSLAVSSPYKGKEAQMTADFIPITAFGKTAQLFEDYVKKGDRVGIVGHLKTRSYANKEGHQQFVMEVLVDKLYFLELKPTEEN